MDATTDAEPNGVVPGVFVLAVGDRLASVTTNSISFDEEVVLDIVS